MYKLNSNNLNSFVMNRKHIFCLLFFSALSFCKIHAQNSPVSNSDKGFSMHGVVKMGDVVSGGRFLLTKQVPYEQIVEQTTFFKGDSLQGYDQTTALNSMISKLRIFSELKVYMHRDEIAFVKKKYHISELPFEKNRKAQAVQPGKVLSSACNNVDFENGDYTGWTGQVGYNDNSLAPLTVTSTGISTAGMNADIYTCGAYHTLMTSAAANDPYGNFSPLDIGGGSYAFRLGGEDVNTQGTGAYITDCAKANMCASGDATLGGSGGEILSQTFTVTAGNTLFSFNYAAVLNDGGHPAGYQPYFGIQVFDHTGAVISCLTQTVELSAGKIPPGGHYAGLTDCGGVSGDTVYVIPWQTSSINLSPYVGQALTVQFTAAGCALGRHFGYAYFDASCGAVQITASNNSPCLGSNVILSAPPQPGQVYTWSGPGIVSTSGNTATVNTSGTYSVTVGMPPCSYSLSTTITFATPPTITVTPTYTTCLNAPVTFSVSGATSYTWSPTTNVSGVNSATPTVTPSSTTTAVYSVTGTTGNCASTAKTVTLTVKALPNILIVPAPSGTICSSSNVVLTANGANTYTWSSGPVTNTISVTGVNSGTTPITNTISVTGTNTLNCINSSTYTVTISPTPTITLASPTYTICSGSNTSFSVSSSATSYAWTVPLGGSIVSGSTTATPNVMATNTTAVATALVYTVTGTLGSCASVARTVTLTVNPKPTLTVTPNPATICIGGSSTLTVLGASTYTWISPTGGGLSGTSTGSVTATPTSNGILTYTVNASNIYGCMNTGTASVTINTLPSLTITPTNVYSICNGGSQTFTVSGASSYSWTPAATLTGANTPNPTASPSSTTIYSVTGINSNNCSNATSPLTVTVNVTSPPILALAANSYTICNGGSQTFSVSGANSYTWTPATALTNTNTASPAANPSVTTTYTVIGTESGCIASPPLTLTLTVNQLPTLTVTPSPAVICMGDNSILTAIGASTYTWASPAGGGLSGITVGSVTATPAVSGTLIYTVTATDVNTCTNVATTSVTINTLPSLTITPTNVYSICNGGSQTFTVSGASSYSWTPAATLTGANTPNPTASPSSTTIYSVTGINSNNCSNATSPLTVTVNVTSPPILALAANSYTICNGGSQTFSVSGANSYTWTPATALTNTNTASPAANPSVTTTYTVIGTESGCIASPPLTLTLTVNQLPTLTVTPSPAVICMGDNSILTAIGASTYTWASPAGGGLSGITVGSVTATPAVSGTLIYTVTATDVNTCTNVATTSVTINTLPSLTVTPVLSGTLCSGSSEVLIVIGASTYTWSSGPVTNTVSITGINNGATTTTNTISVMGTNALNCINSITYTLTVSPTPTLTLAPPTYTICSGSSTSFSVSSIATSYVWAVPTGGAILNGSTTATPNATAINTGTSPTGLTYTVSGSIGSCTSIAETVLLTVNPLPTLAISSSPTSICLGNNSTLAATGASTYTWISPTGGGLSATTGIGGIATPILPGILTYTINGMDINTCTNTVTASITVNSLPIVNMNGVVVDTAQCGQATGGISINGNNVVSGGTPIYHYQWFNGSTPILNDTLLSLSNVASGTYSLQVTDALGCKANVNGGIGTITFNVPPSSNPMALFSTNPSPATGDIPLDIIFINQSTGATNYSWSFGDGNGSTLFNPTNTYTNIGSYTAVLSAMAKGCPFISTYSVTIIAEIPTTLVIPNVFTPNGDGVNDQFFILNTGLNTLNCDIFNRWGELLYTISAPNQSWDGKTPHGDNAPDGTYMFILQAKGSNNKAYKQQGTITLVR